ncbi:sulfotransferase [Pararhodospirillum photometricum]|nr:sulfotransferase [Pararhodospirillum photometricum]
MSQDQTEPEGEARLFEGIAPHAVACPLDPGGLAARARRIMASQTPVFFAARRSHGDPSRLPVFLVGLATPTAKRIRAVLSAHSHIHGAPSLGLIPALVASLESWDRHYGRARVFPESLEALSADDSLKAAQWVLQRLQEEAPGADHVLDGQGLDAALVGLVHLLLPQAPLIVCLDAAHAGNADTRPREWRRLQAVQQRLLHHWRAVLPGRLIEVSGEDLHAQPRETLHSLFARLGLGFEERLLQVMTPPAGPEVPGAFVGAAVAHIRAGRLAQAEATLGEVLRQVPGHPAAVHLLGVVHFRQGHPESALHLMRQSLELIGTPVREWQHNLAVVRKALKARLQKGAGEDLPEISEPPG